MPDKTISLEKAVELVPSGATLAIGGVTLYRRPVAFVRALLKRHAQTGSPEDLTLLAFTAGLECDWLIGAGMISQVRTCYFGLEIFGFAPMFTYHANRGEIGVLEETEASLALGLRAAISGIGFMPGRAWLGTDLPRLRPDVRTILDPYSCEELVAFPAIHANVAVIHALRADQEGNAQIGGNKGIDVELSLAATTIIVTAEEVVPELERADLVAPFVHAVAHAPRGAAPTSCHPLYPIDGGALMDYTGRVSDPESFKKYMDQLLAF